MVVELQLRAIKPRKGRVFPAANAAAVSVVMRQWAGRTLSDVATYPPQQPTRYRRTGDLGRNWRLSVGMAGGTLTANVTNGIAYASFVQGFTSKDPKQTKVMAGKGWRSLETVGRSRWRQIQPELRAALGSPKSTP